MATKSFFQRMLSLAMAQITDPVTVAKVELAFKACKKTIPKSRLMYQYYLTSAVEELPDLLERDFEMSNVWTDYGSWSGFDNETLSNDAEIKYASTSSLKVETNESTGSENLGAILFLGMLMAYPNKTLRVKAMVLASEGSPIRLRAANLSKTTNVIDSHVGTGDWQELSVDFTVTMGEYYGIYFDTGDLATPGTFYIGKVVLNDVTA